MSDETLTLPTPSFRVLSQHAADALRRAILSGRFKPGDRLVERELAVEFNISRAPVREALRFLAKEGLVAVKPHRGAIVTTISPDLVIDAFSVRALLEGMAARLATSRLTEDDIARLSELVDLMEQAGRAGDPKLLSDLDIEFHRVLTSTCQRPILLEALSAISNRTYLLISISRYAYPLDRVAELHTWILEAVRSRDPDAVEAAVRDHLGFGQRTLLRHLTAQSIETPENGAPTMEMAAKGSPRSRAR